LCFINSSFISKKNPNFVDSIFIHKSIWRVVSCFFQGEPGLFRQKLFAEMSASHCLPQVGDVAPSFSAQTQKGDIDFPAYSAGCWCILFVHPANFTAAWTMYSTFLALKERWFDGRNTKMLALSNEPLRHTEWSQKVRRYIGIYLGAPVIEDLDFSIAQRYGMTTSTRRKHPSQNDRIAFIIDPQGIIRVIIENKQPSIEKAIVQLEYELDRLQNGGATSATTLESPLSAFVEVTEQCDAIQEYRWRPAYFRKDDVHPN
jgi:alkyl hydroperoxide reductase subunit AhpC